MKILAHSIKSNEETKQIIHKFLSCFKDLGIDIYVTKKLSENNKTNDSYIISKSSDIKNENIDFIICFGGDGTVLNSLDIIKNINAPVVGVNTGNLGFLTKISNNCPKELASDLKNKNYKISKRNVLEVSFDDKKMYALNEISINRKVAEILKVDAHIDGKYLATYRSDGLIISTSTGSTAYSLSCGGPIIVPETRNFIITPIAPHNLNLRPIIISDKSKIECNISHNNKEDKFFKLSADSKFIEVSNNVKIKIKKANFCVEILEFPNEDFFNTIREKLLWGEDYRKN